MKSVNPDSKGLIVRTLFFCRNMFFFRRCVVLLMSVKLGVKLDTGKARNIWQITTGALMLVKISRLMRKQGATWKERKKIVYEK